MKKRKRLAAVFNRREALYALETIFKTARQGSGLKSLRSLYFLAGGKSVQLPCATSAAMPIDSPSVGCG